MEVGGAIKIKKGHVVVPYGCRGALLPITCSFLPIALSPPPPPPPPPRRCCSSSHFHRKMWLSTSICWAARGEQSIGSGSGRRHRKYKYQNQNEKDVLSLFHHPALSKLKVAAGTKDAPTPSPSSIVHDDDDDADAQLQQLELKPLPYPLEALEPYMRRETVEYHWGTHQRSHVDSLNRMIPGTQWEGMQPPHILLSSFNNHHLPLFSHAAQIWNHDFFWHSMKPAGGGKPQGMLMELIHRDFGSFDSMIQQLKDAALTQFGSGWAWLSYKANRLDVGNATNPLPSEDDNKLVISKTPNAVNPMLWGHTPLLGIDVWEHAYYMDYENRRADYVTTFLEKLVSWDTVSSRLSNAMEQAAKGEEDRKSNEAGNPELTSRRPMEMYLDSDDNQN